MSRLKPRPTNLSDALKLATHNTPTMAGAHFREISLVEVDVEAGDLEVGVG